LDAIDGCRCVPSLGDLPEPVDLVVLSVAAAPAAALLAEIAETRKADSIVLIPGGLEEKPGAGGAVARMREALARARTTPWRGPVVNGGNCLGVRSQPGHYNTLFIPAHKLPLPHGAASPVALLAASGAFAVSKTSKLGGVNPLYTITLGNQMDLTIADYLEYLMDDERIEVFACYLEGFKPLDGARFLAAAAEITARGRSVIVYRAGRTRAGAAAAASHTAAVAGDDAVFRGLAEASGVVLADSLEDFEDLVRLFTMLRDRLPDGLRLGALSNAGFECVAIADRLGPFQLAAWTQGTTSQLAATLDRARIGDIVSVRNPLDLTPILGDADYERVTRLVLEDPNVDVGLVGCVPLTGALHTLPAGPGHDDDLLRADGLVQRLLRIKPDVSKPWVAVVDAGRLYDPMVLLLEQGGVPTFRAADRALRLFGTWCTHRLRGKVV
jgi:acyl-CoA synthetase (NDP forming)